MKKLLLTLVFMLILSVNVMADSSCALSASGDAAALPSGPSGPSASSSSAAGNNPELSGSPVVISAENQKSSSGPTVLTGPYKPEEWQVNLWELPIIPVNGNKNELILPKNVTYYTERANDPGPESAYPDTYLCPVVWDLDSLDLSSPGRKTVKGTLMPEEGYIPGENVSGQAEYSIMVTSPGMEKETVTEASITFDSYLMAVDGEFPQKLLDKNAACYTRVHGEFFECPVKWDFSQVNTKESGMYTVYGMPDLPEGFALPDDFQPFTVQLGVVRSDFIDISAGWINPANSAILYCDWLYTPENPDNIKLEYAIGSGEWIKAQTGEDEILQSVIIIGRQNRMMIYLNQLEQYTDYYFRLVYEGQASHELYVRIEDENLTLEAGGSGGNRDGGDINGDKLPDHEQNISDSVIDQNTDSGSNSYSDLDTDSSGTPEPVTEVITDTSTSISGMRLKQLTSINDTVLFEKQGISVELPSDFLNSLDLKDNELLEVIVEQPQKNTFRIQVYADGQILSQLSKADIYLPFSQPDDEQACVDQSGTIVSDLVYDETSGTAMCTIYASGIYQILPAKFINPEQIEIDFIENHSSEEVIFLAEEDLKIMSLPEEISLAEAPLIPEKLLTPASDEPEKTVRAIESGATDSENEVPDQAVITAAEELRRTIPQKIIYTAGIISVISLFIITVTVLIIRKHRHEKQQHK